MRQIVDDPEGHHDWVIDAVVDCDAALETGTGLLFEGGDAEGDDEGHGVLTSRNWLAPLRTLLARSNPDLIASNEGGSNLTLVRAALGGISDRSEVAIHPGAPERRAMALEESLARDPSGPGGLPAARAARARSTFSCDHLQGNRFPPESFTR